MLLADDRKRPENGHFAGMQLSFEVSVQTDIFYIRLGNATHQPDCVKLPSEFFP